MHTDLPGKPPACPWCGKPFLVRDLARRTVLHRLRDAWRAAKRAWRSSNVLAICPNSYCTIVPYGEFENRDDALSALSSRIPPHLTP